MKRQLAKIYYQNREVEYLTISLDGERDEDRSVYIGASVHISGKHEIIAISYDFTEHDDDGKEKEFNLFDWEVKDHLDKVQVNHTKDSAGIMIEWLSPQGDIKSSLFIPMTRILHISVDNPESKHHDEKPVKRTQIPR
jgi:hypothetical protein